MIERLDSSHRPVSTRRCMTVSLKFLRFIGLWPRAGDNIYWFYTFFVCFNALLAMLLFIVALFDDDMDTNGFIKNTGNVLTMFPIIVTAVSILCNKGSYDKIVAGMQSTFHSESMADSGARILFVNKILAEEKNAIVGYFSVVGSTALAYLFKPLVGILFVESNEDIRIELPFEMKPLFGRQELDYLFQFMIVVVFVPTMTALDAFSFAIVKYAGNQFEVLNMLLDDSGPAGLCICKVHGEQGLQEPCVTCISCLPGNRTTDIGSEKDEDKASKWEKTFIDFVQHHQAVLSNVQDLADHLSPLMFAHYIMSSANVCLVGYQTAMAADISQMVTGLTHLTMVLSRIFLLSFFSSEITEQSKNVGQMAYSSNWFACTGDLKRTLTMVIARAQKPVVIRTGWFGILSMETFAQLMQAAYSYYTLLKNFNIS